MANKDQTSPGPGEPGYSEDLRRDIANVITQSDETSEEDVSEHDQSGSTPFTVFDYLGLGFILEPPAVVVHAVMTGEELRWSNGLYAIPFIALGAVFIYIGRNWAHLRVRVNGRVVEAVDRLSRSYAVPFLIVLFALSGIAILPIWIWPPNSNASSTTSRPPNADEIAAAVVKVLHATPQAGGASNEATPKPLMPPRSKQAINELLDESGSILNVFEKSGMSLINEWRESSTTQNPERVCLDIDSRALQDKITGLANKLDGTQRELAAIFDKNRIDQSEFNKALGAPTVGPHGFTDAAQTLRQYAHEINLLGEHPACETLIQSGNIPSMLLSMSRGFDNFGIWVAHSAENLGNYRDNLRKELRDAP